MNSLSDMIATTLRAILHDEGILLVMVGAPLIYAAIYSGAYGSEVVREAPIVVVDHSHTPSSRALIRDINSGSACRVAYVAADLEEARHLLYAREAYGIVVIPHRYVQNLTSDRQAVVALYLDGGYFLIYRTLYSYLATLLTTRGIGVEVGRLFGRSITGESLLTAAHPITHVDRTLFNPLSGYGVFVLPAILILILQQTLLIGLGMLRAGRRDTLTRRQTLGQGIAAWLLYLPTTIWFFTGHYALFGLPMAGEGLIVGLFIALYLSVVTLFALAVSRLFRFREEPLLLLFWCSIPLLMISGVSFPREAMPSWLYALGRIFPSSPAIDGLIRLQTMGATFGEIRGEVALLLLQAFVYGAVAFYRAPQKK